MQSGMQVRNGNEKEMFSFFHWICTSNTASASIYLKQPFAPTKPLICKQLYKYVVKGAKRIHAPGFLTWIYFFFYSVNLHLLLRKQTNCWFFIQYISSSTSTLLKTHSDLGLSILLCLIICNIMNQKGWMLYIGHHHIRHKC